ncbi:unnamed protein product [Rhizophagus irregularis]|nr:unnamed protein product [Rhizophagus irregularis]
MEVNETIRVQSQNFGMKDTKRNGAIWFGFRASERRMPIKTEQTRFSLGASERMALIERNNTVGFRQNFETRFGRTPIFCRTLNPWRPRRTGAGLLKTNPDLDND